MIALGGGASFAAESAVPGDMLYPVKVQVNEQVRAALAVSAEADAEWEATLAERRLDEAHKLEAKGELDASVAAELGAAFSGHSETAFKAAQELEANGHADIAARIIAHLDDVAERHADIFAGNDAQAEAHARAFVIPHVLEKSGVVAPRDSASGQASGRMKGEMKVADMDADGEADLKVKGNMEVEGGASTGVRESPTRASTGASSQIDIEL